MTAAKQFEPISVDDYLAGELVSDIKHEYSAGYVYAMAGARTQHNRVTGNFFGALHSRLHGKPCEPFNSDMKVRVKFPSHTRFYYPDGMVVCTPNDPQQSYQDQPVVIAEVVSDSTRRVDENEKRDAYFTIASLDVYLVIETDVARVVAHRRTPNGFVTEIYEGQEAIVELPTIEVDLPLAELYERVEFAQ